MKNSPYTAFVVPEISTPAAPRQPRERRYSQAEEMSLVRIDMYIRLMKERGA